ncbi:Asp23/Gls24 family envelope stress response protein, partial [Staphylococcus pseudintermedius]
EQVKHMTGFEVVGAIIHVEDVMTPKEWQQMQEKKKEQKDKQGVQ